MRTSLFLIAVLSLTAQPPTSTPEEALTAQQKAAVDAGIKLHDQGKYNEAIERYQSVTAQTPRNSLAWYEMAFSYSELKNWSDCKESARAGLRLDTPRRPALLMLLANCQDSAGESGAAIETYLGLLASHATESNPRQTGLVHFNLGIAYVGQSQFDKARDQFQLAIRNYPRHSSSHLRLANLYTKSNDRISALLAFGVFLSLEPPKSQRTAAALQQVREILSSGVSKTGLGKTTITISPGRENNPDGDFTPESMALALATAAQQMEEKNKQPSAFAGYEGQWKSLLSVMLSADRRKVTGQTFSGQVYFPFYEAVERNQWTGAFVSHIFRSAALPPSEEEKKALEKSAAFEEWMAAWGK